jgi:hypothetical protein
MNLPTSLDFVRMLKQTFEGPQETPTVEDNMTYPIPVTITDAAPPTEEKQREFMYEKLTKYYHKHLDDAETHYGFADEKAPRTRSEMKDRLAAGRYIIEGDDPSDDDYDARWPRTPWIRWKNPETKVDFDGYETAKEKIKDAFEDVHNAIAIKPLADGLAALTSYKSKTFH